jgi:hypothetical protein
LILGKGKVIGKIVPVLNKLGTIPWRRMGSGCIDPHFLHLGTSWKWVVSFTPRPLYSLWRSLLYPFYRRLVGPHVWTTWRRENSCPYRDSKSDPSIVQPVAIRYTDSAILFPSILGRGKKFFSTPQSP